MTSRMSVINNASHLPWLVPLPGTSDPLYRPHQRVDPHDINATHVLVSQQADEGAEKPNAILGQTTASLLTNAKPVTSCPLFRKISANDAVTKLRLMLPGDIIIRPNRFDKYGIIISCRFANFHVLESLIAMLKLYLVRTARWSMMCY